MGQSHRLHCEKGPAEEVQPATGAADTVLLSHHWIRPLHVNNCLVQLSYQIWPQKTTEGSPDCWANHWYNPPHSPRTVLIQREQKSCQNPPGPFTSLFELLSSGRRYRAQLFLLSLFFVLSLSRYCTAVASVTKNKFIACVNIPGNKAHSDSDSDYAMLYCHITLLSMFFFYSMSSVHLSLVWLLQHFYLILCKTS